MDQQFAAVAALALSFLALLISAATAYRQLTLMRGANILPIVLESFGETRTQEWTVCREYINERLATEHDPRGGLVGLPEPIKHQVRKVAFFFDDLGKLVAHRVVDEDLILGAYGGSVLAMWRALAPYIAAQREIDGAGTAVYFEDLARRAHTRTGTEIYARIGLRPFPE
ncbi:hypothetical protein AB0M19_28105 [Streptomyces sp. NPDC051920]|uniref:DUF4760 domain-containing protein n=1 Tax=Streptomyces sp. NPDC051920 TaxID=3155523 RepID=UPI00344AC2DB